MEMNSSTEHRPPRRLFKASEFASFARHTFNKTRSNYVHKFADMCMTS